MTATITSSAPALPPPIERYLSEFVVRARRRALWRSAGLAGAIFLLWMMICCGLDRLLQLSSAWRLALLLGAVAAAIAIIVPSIRAATRRTIDYLSASAKVENLDIRFQQRLITVTSCALDRSSVRPSDELLGELLQQVEQETSSKSPADLFSGKTFTWRVVSLAVPVLLLIALPLVPQLRMRQLIKRFILPMADIEPVTTTRLQVITADQDIAQGKPLRIDANAQRLGDGNLWLFVSEDAQNWSRFHMSRLTPEQFAFDLKSVDCDLHYYVAGGDAVSRHYAIRVLRTPAVKQFTVRYAYPGYIGRSPLTVMNDDGLIEAPAGTTATLTINATEALSSAAIRMDDKQLAMSRTGDAKTWQTDIHVDRDAVYSLDLISTRQVAGNGPSGLHIRAAADRPPVVQLRVPATSLRLNPRDVAPLAYRASDDYGIRALTIRAQKNDSPPRDFAIAAAGNQAILEDLCNFDLASMQASIGDVVWVSMIATDAAGQSSASERVAIVISPRTLDVDSPERIAELKRSGQIVESLISALSESIAPLDVSAQPAPAAAAIGRAGRSISQAAETATLLRQVLMRALVRSERPPLSNALTAWIDVAQIQSSAAEQVFNQLGEAAPDCAAAGRTIATSVEKAKELQTELRLMLQAEQAAALLVNRENFLAMTQVPATDDPKLLQRRQETAAAMQQEISAAAAELGLNPAAADLDEQLQRLIDAGNALPRAQGLVDFAVAAAQWSQNLQKDPLHQTDLSARLSTAAAAEALRHDGDLNRAQDLESAASAVRAIEWDILRDAGNSRSPQFPAAEQFALAMQALQRFHEIQRQPELLHHAMGIRMAERFAAESRNMIAFWGDRESGPTRPSEYTDESRRLAIAAGSALSAPDDQTSEQFDDEFLAIFKNPKQRRVGDAERLSIDLVASRTTVQELARIHRQQVNLARDTRLASEKDAPVLSDRQRQVAEAIAVAQQRSDELFRRAAEDPQWREQSVFAMIAAQEQLAAMPQRISEVLAAVAFRRDRIARMHAARGRAAIAEQSDRAVAERSAAQAERDASDAANQLLRMKEPVSVGASDELARKLQMRAPQTDAAQAVVQTQLGPALHELEQAAAAANDAAADRAAADARQAIGVIQLELARAQEELIQQDPLIAAGQFARAATESLARTPPDLRQAHEHQRETSVALLHAWDDAIHDAVQRRLAAAPSMRMVYGGSGPPQPVGANANAATVLPASEIDSWQMQLPDSHSAASFIRQPDPPGYEEQLKLYFEALGKAQGTQ